MSENSFREKLQRLQSYKQSLYSPKGWSSENVDQSSKWLVDVESVSHKAMGINIWKKLSLVHHISHDKDNLHLQMKRINLSSEFPEK